MRVDEISQEKEDLMHEEGNGSKRSQSSASNTLLQRRGG